MVDQLMTEYAEPEVYEKLQTRRQKRKLSMQEKGQITVQSEAASLLQFMCSSFKLNRSTGVLVSIPSNMFMTHGLVLLKMKKALPSGMGGVFSLIVRSDSL